MIAEATPPKRSAPDTSGASRAMVRPMPPDRPTLAQAERRFEELAGVPFARLLDERTLGRMQRNKGGSGHAIERLLGVPGGSAALDCADGELKTYRCDVDGFPVETVAVTRTTDVDVLLARRPFAATRLYRKLRRSLFLGVWKESDDPGEWRVAIAFRLDARPGTDWYDRLERSYDHVIEQLRRRLLDGGEFATVSAELLQMRVRDSRPYTPLRSRRLGRRVCDKGVGFYLQRAMIAECVAEARACR